MRILLHPEGAGGAGDAPATAAELKRDLAALRADLEALKSSGSSKAEIDALKKDLADTRAKLEAAEAREKAAAPKEAPSEPAGWPW